MVESKSSLSFILAMRLDKALLATMAQDGVGTLNGMVVAAGAAQATLEKGAISTPLFKSVCHHFMPLG
jgi:hypothetical protein